jgi:hypothetical protein
MTYACDTRTSMSESCEGSEADIMVIERKLAKTWDGVLLVRQVPVLWSSRLEVGNFKGGSQNARIGAEDSDTPRLVESNP